MTNPEMSQIAVGEVTVWDFGFRYNLQLMDLPELEALMGKFEGELRLTGREHEARYWQINDILGKIYKEIMKRKLVNYWDTLEYKKNHI
jgi:hypothetical protein